MEFESNNNGSENENLQVFSMKRNKNVKQKHLESPKACLNRLSHHQIPQISTFQNAFPDPAGVSSVAATVLQYPIPEESCVASITDLDVRLLQRAEDDSELDSAESDVDPLEHAGAFTTEEVSRIYLEKLQKLKSLYVGEYKRLYHILRESKREYLQALKTEKETMMSVHAQPKETTSERVEYEELKSLASYHRHLGKDSYFYRKKLEKRAQIAETLPAKLSFPVGCVKCIYSEGSWRCGLKSVPLSKYCFKHIMQDERQVLFRPCGSTQGGGEECEIPIIPLPHTPMCVYHTPLPNPLPLSDLWRETEEVGHPRNPKIIDLSETSAFIISEMPPENVMEGDGIDNLPEKDTRRMPSNSGVKEHG